MCRITNPGSYRKPGWFVVNLALRSQHLLSCYGTMDFFGKAAKVGEKGLGLGIWDLPLLLKSIWNEMGCIKYRRVICLIYNQQAL